MDKEEFMLDECICDDPASEYSYYAGHDGELVANMHLGAVWPLVERLQDEVAYWKEMVEWQRAVIKKELKALLQDVLPILLRMH